MAGLHETGGNVFDIPPLDDFGLGNGFNGDLDNFILPPSELGNAHPIPDFQGFNLSSPPPIPDIPFDSFGDFPPIDVGESPEQHPVSPLKSPGISNDHHGNGIHGDTVGNMSSKGTAGDNEFGDFSSSSFDNQFDDFATSKSKEDEGFTTFSTGGEDKFGTFTTASEPSNDNQFGDFATPILNDPPPVEISDASFGDLTKPPSIAATISNNESTFNNFTLSNDDNQFGDFTTAQDDDFGNFTLSNQTDEFGGFAMSKPQATPTLDSDNEFGDFTTSKETNEFGSFSTSTAKPTEATPTVSNDDDEFGDFTTSKETNEFGSFSTSTKPSEATPTVDNDEDEFGSFDAFTKPSSQHTSTASLGGSGTWKKESSSSSNAGGNKIKVSVDVMVACFPLPTTSHVSQDPSKPLKELLSEGEFQMLFKQVNSTNSLFQWNQSLLQERFYSALKVDPLLVPSGAAAVGGVNDDPFAIGNLMGDLSTQGEPNSFNLSRKTSSEGGATLLDLSLPMSPTDKNSKDSAQLFLDDDLKELDFNVSGSAQSLGVAKGDTPTSWMDSELLELENELPTTTTGSSTVSNLDWLNKPELTTMVKQPPPETDLLADPDSHSGSMEAGLDLLPSNNGWGSNMFDNNNEEHSFPPLTSSMGSSIQSLSSEPLLIPPDPILTGSVPMVTATPTMSITTPTIPLDPSPPPQDQQTTIASQGLDMVMELTSKAIVTDSAPTTTVAPPTKANRFTLTPAQTSIDILEDQLLEMTSKRSNTTSPLSVTMEEESGLSREAKLLLDRLPNMDFIRMK